MKNAQSIVFQIPIPQAQRYQNLSLEQKKVLTAFVVDLLSDSEFDLSEIMDFIGFRAEQRGLTPEIFEKIINEQVA